MKKLVLAVLLVFLCLLPLAVGCEVVSVIGSGTLETRDMNYDGFTDLNISHAFRSTVTRADEFSISVTADDNLYEFIKVKKVGSTLYVGLRAGSYIRTTQIVKIGMPDLNRITLSGAASADVSGFQSTDSTKYDLSGASRLDLEGVKAGDAQFGLSGASRVSGDIDIRDADFELSGASNLELSGSAEDITVDASGASRLVIEDMPCGDVTVDLSGASSAVINASGKIGGSLSGASILRYIGSPNLGEFSTSGGSTVSQK